MASDSASVDFIIWGIDQTAYGPVELPTLVAWVKDERVTAETWVFLTADNVWMKAAQIPELQIFFRPKTARSAPSDSTADSLNKIDPHKLRRVKILGGMTDEQLERFAGFVEMEKATQWAVIVRQGDHADTMYLILEGELRVRIILGGKETALATSKIGGRTFFGDQLENNFDFTAPVLMTMVFNAEQHPRQNSAPPPLHKVGQAKRRTSPRLSTCAIGKTLFRLHPCRQQALRRFHQDGSCAA